MLFSDPSPSIEGDINSWHSFIHKNSSDVMDCTICPAGYYCPNDTANRYEIECDEGQVLS